jgi:hypothetical protein
MPLNCKAVHYEILKLCNQRWTSTPKRSGICGCVQNNEHLKSIILNDVEGVGTAARNQKT